MTLVEEAGAGFNGLDSACGCTIDSRLTAEQVYTTLERKIAYRIPYRIPASGRRLKSLQK